MSTDFNKITNLVPVPDKMPFYADDKDLRPLHPMWRKFFNDMRDRVGGSSGAVIYDTAEGSSALLTLEGQLLAAVANLETQLTGYIAQIVEQVQQQLQEQPFPEEANLGPIIQAAISTAAVTSVFGRTGAVVATEGDYSLTQLSDVTITTPASNQVVTYNGTTWVNGSVPASGGAPNYETAVATAAQTVFNTTINTVANGSGKNYLMVTVNGAVMDEGGANDYTVTGANQITFNTGLALNDKVTFRAWS